MCFKYFEFPSQEMRFIFDFFPEHLKCIAVITRKSLIFVSEVFSVHLVHVKNPLAFRQQCILSCVNSTKIS